MLSLTFSLEMTVYCSQELYNEEEVEKVLEILATYEVASDQKLKMEKPKVSFSGSIEQEK